MGLLVALFGAVISVLYKRIDQIGKALPTVIISRESHDPQLLFAEGPFLTRHVSASFPPNSSEVQGTRPVLLIHDSAFSTVSKKRPSLANIQCLPWS